MKYHDVIVIGAGASGLMAAMEAGKRGRGVLILERSNKPGKKILMSGGGRCNFTNLDVSADHYVSHNPHFCKSALSRYTQWDFISLVQRYGIVYHERDHGQLFCDESARHILAMLLQECERAGARVQLHTEISTISRDEQGFFCLKTNQREYQCQSLIVASGGLSIPKMGASPFGYKIAEQFGIKVWPPRAGLVPFTLHARDKQRLESLSGIAVDCIVSNQRQRFRENVLFTHRGLSGPAILQISSYWYPGEEIVIDLSPDVALEDLLARARAEQPDARLKTVVGRILPKRLVVVLLGQKGEQKMKSFSPKQLQEIASGMHAWKIQPNGTEGYRTAEVTLGGVDCDAISSKTMEAIQEPGLYFVGEVLDVTGWLGGYNFQWAWSSGWCAGQYA